MIGLEAADDPAAAAAAPEADDDEPLESEPALAAWATIELAADKAPARFGRDPPDGGAIIEANGDEAEAERRFEAKLATPDEALDELPDEPAAGLV